ncbi:hypothetical protein BCR44DRAFT_1431932 [Catenaria anguillulae PL171]|uniref:Uncharacterized protein n=1 Tax=Catenaria anguillulae PL171 TaxID=765915 RepID=A0A1Y2HSX3_9FUNG|nr:hypothetical protein BCR44DRAFT_1431932 [Catenaria anguillulae PL171]
MIPMSIRHQVFLWSSSSVFLSAVLLINVTTCLSALYAWRLTKKSTLYPTLATVAVAHVFDFYLSVISSGSWREMAQGYQHRSYWVLGKTRLPRTSQGLLALAGISILLVGTQIFVVWSIFDSLIAGGTSVAFVVLLRQMATPSANGKELRPGLRRLLSNMIRLLVVEVLMIGTDPNWLTLYTCESIRMLLCSSFLVSLNRLLRNKQIGRPNELSKAASGAGLPQLASGGGVPGRDLAVNTNMTKQLSITTEFQGSKGLLLSPSSAADAHPPTTPIGGDAARLLQP